MGGRGSGDFILFFSPLPLAFITRKSLPTKDLAKTGQAIINIGNIIRIDK